NIVSTACFNITYTDQDNINLTNTYPMLDNATSSYKMIQCFLQPNESKTYTLNDTVQFWDIYDSPNKTS
ncbi:MAG: hypothetical protein IJ772_00415, partial [Bacilli bacterium]|nr:hypothetical protein [Bacilli bacterium]MBR1817291.1 hypothetical protein [Bacilli bacterium]